MIYQSNLEEFYRVRIGILTHRALLTPDKKDPLSGLLPEAKFPTHGEEEEYYKYNQN